MQEQVGNFQWFDHYCTDGTGKEHLLWGCKLINNKNENSNQSQSCTHIRGSNQVYFLEYCLQVMRSFYFLFLLLKCLFIFFLPSSYDWNKKEENKDRYPVLFFLLLVLLSFLTLSCLVTCLFINTVLFLFSLSFAKLSECIKWSLLSPTVDFNPTVKSNSNTSLHIDHLNFSFSNKDLTARLLLVMQYLTSKDQNSSCTALLFICGGMRCITLYTCYLGKRQTTKKETGGNLRLWQRQWIWQRDLTSFLLWSQLQTPLPAIVYILQKSMICDRAVIGIQPARTGRTEGGGGGNLHLSDSSSRWGTVGGQWWRGSST